MKFEPKEPGEVMVRWLEQRSDGLWHPTMRMWSESPGALIPITTIPCKDAFNQPAFLLLTPRRRILAVEFVQ